MWPKGGGRGRGDWGGAGGKTVKIWQDSGLDYTALRCRVLCVQPSQDSDKPKFRDCLPGLKVLSCGWEWGWESLPPSLPPSLPQSVTTMESTALARKELSLPAICKTGAGRGRRGGEVGGEKGGSRLQGDSARNPLPRDLVPGPPDPEEALPSPGSCSLPPPCRRPPALCPQEGGLQDFQPSLGCLLSFSKPSSRGRREPCQDKSPSPTAPAPSPLPASLFLPPHLFQTPFPV